MEQKAQSGQRRNTIIIILLIVIIFLLAGVLFFAMNRGGGDGDEMDIGDNATPKIAYAEGVTLVDDPDALQKAVDEMYKLAAEDGMALEYNNSASSEDGQKFSCYLANAVENRYDMYIDIYSDATLTNEVFLSGLIRPGYSFREIELNQKLEPGTHTVYVAFTQVEEDLETLHGQVLVTMDFIVSE